MILSFIFCVKIDFLRTSENSVFNWIFTGHLIEAKYPVNRILANGVT